MVVNFTYKVALFALFDIVTLCSSLHLTSNGKIRLSSPCRSDVDCVENAYCTPSQSTCYCKEGYIPQRTTNVSCLKEAELMGDPCTVHKQCHVTFGVSAECRENVCQCSEGSAFRDGRCYKLRGYGKKCRSTRYCYIEGGKSYCDRGRCVCTWEYHISNDKTRCIKDALLGDICSNDEDCVNEHSKCSSTCVCKLEYVLHHYGRKTICLKATESIGDYCEQDVQCEAYLPNSYCKNEVCSCHTHFHRRGTLCVKDVGLHLPCTHHEECVTPSHTDSNTTEVRNVGCYEGICGCAPNYIYTQDFCDCIGYSELKSGISRCKIDAILLFMIVFFAANIYRF